MKGILVDTSVWVDHFRQRNETLVHLLNLDLALTHPMILVELACGTPPPPARADTQGHRSAATDAAGQLARSHGVHRTRTAIWPGVRTGRHGPIGFHVSHAGHSAVDARQTLGRTGRTVRRTAPTHSALAAPASNVTTGFICRNASI